jgi:hypothetical protein
VRRVDELRLWEQEISSEQDGLARQLEPLLARREQLIQKLELVRRLIAVEATSTDSATNGIRAATNPQTTAVVGSGNAIQSAVRDILQTKGRPMHIAEIRAALVQKGIPIPGKGTDANVIVHLRRAPDLFTKRGRGMYGLKGRKSDG